MSSNFYDGKEILITGGSGSIGKVLSKQLLDNYKVRGLRVYSRTEKLQWEMKNEFKEYKNISYILGDIRNYENLKRACRGVDLIIHAAAMKEIVSAEENPDEAIDININGSRNVIKAAIESSVLKVIYLNTDKSVNPINTYGLTKSVAERLFLKGGVYSGNRTKLGIIRYGNIIASAMSIVPYFKKLNSEGSKIPITHKEMCRYWNNINDIADFIINKMPVIENSQIYIPKMKSLEVEKFAEYIVPGAKFEYVGIRRGEKIHEDLINKEESHRTKILDDCYVIDNNFWSDDKFVVDTNNSPRLSKKELMEMLK